MALFDIFADIWLVSGITITKWKPDRNFKHHQRWVVESQWKYLSESYDSHFWDYWDLIIQEELQTNFP